MSKIMRQSFVLEHKSYDHHQFNFFTFSRDWGNFILVKTVCKNGQQAHLIT